MARRVQTRAEAEDRESIFSVLVWHIVVALSARPLLMAVLGCVVLAMVWQSARVVLILLAVALIAVGVWQRKRLRAIRREVVFQARWEGAPGRVGLAAELGLVPPASRKPPHVRLKPTDAGEDLVVTCPPGLLQETVVEAVPAIQQAMYAVEATAEPARGKPQVTVHLIYDDVLARDVNADWVTAPDPGPSAADPFAEGEITHDFETGTPYWEDLGADTDDD